MNLIRLRDADGGHAMVMDLSQVQMNVELLFESFAHFGYSLQSVVKL